MATIIEKNTYVRVKDIVGSKTTEPMIHISRSSWWAGVRSGIYPRPIKIGPRTTVWKLSDITGLLATLEVEGYTATCAISKPKKDKVEV